MSVVRDASILIVIDTNSSLRGQKISEVSNHIRDLLGYCRPSVKFSIYAASNKLVSDTVQKVDVNKILQQLNAYCTNHSSKFYDGWGLAMNDIPYDDICYTHIVLFTNVGDSASVIYNLDSLTHLLNEKFRRNPQLRLSLIQAGSNTAISAALLLKCNVGGKCNSIVIPDTLAGIRMGFERLKTALRSDLLQTSPYVQMDSQLNSLSTATSGGKSHFYTPNVVNIPTTTSKPLNVQHKLLNVKRERVQQTAKAQGFKVWVGNIPMINQSEILDYLKQWGPCKIETLNGNPNQWAVVAYESQNAVDYAIKYGNGSNFKGQIININKI